jgi:hypothetical protein
VKNSKTTTEAPVKTKPEVDMDTLVSIDTDVMEDSYVYVHCYFQTAMNDLVRIWRTTYLVDQSQGSRSQLVHAENISYAPQWTVIRENTTYSFLLIFSALPKSCMQFDLVEEIAMPGGFVVRNIPRNQTDVYHIDL